MRTLNMQMDEQLLVQKARKGDLNAFNQLILNYQSLAYNVAFRILHNQDDAADALQTSFLNAFHKLEQLEGDRFKSWLLRIVVNRCYDMLRSRKRSKGLSFDCASDWGTETVTELRDPSELPEEFAARNELNRAILAGLQSMREEQRTTLILADIHGYTYDEIASTMNRPVGTVKSNLSRARAKLRSYLLRHSDLLPSSILPLSCSAAST